MGIRGLTPFIQALAPQAVRRLDSRRQVHAVLQNKTMVVDMAGLVHHFIKALSTEDVGVLTASLETFLCRMQDNDTDLVGVFDSPRPPPAKLKFTAPKRREQRERARKRLRDATEAARAADEAALAGAVKNAGEAAGDDAAKSAGEDESGRAAGEDEAGGAAAGLQAFEQAVLLDAGLVAPTLRPTAVHFDAARGVLDRLGLPHTTAPDGIDGEALACRIGRAHENMIVVSNDTDCLPFGAPRVLLNPWPLLCGHHAAAREAQVAKLVTLADVLERLCLTETQFVHMCVGSGCDYCDNIPRHGLRKLYKIMRTRAALTLWDIEKLSDAVDLTKQHRADLAEALRLFEWTRR